MIASQVGVGVRFWGALVVALVAVAFSFRHRLPAPELCTDSVVHVRGADGAAESADLPLKLTPQPGDDSIETFRIVFGNRIATNRPAVLYAGEAVPFAHVTLNGVEVTPLVDLADRETRNLAPQLFPLPRELVRERENAVEIRIPLNYALRGLRLDQICLANTDALGNGWRWSWWCESVVPRICLSVLASILLMVLFAFPVMGRASSLLWYMLVVLLGNVRVLYLSTPAKPGSPLLWNMLADLSMIMAAWAIYRLIRSLWSCERLWIDRALLVVLAGGVLALVLSQVWPWHLRYPRLQMSLWLVVAGSTVSLVWAMAGVISKAHPAEWRPVMWGLLFGALVSMLEAATYRLPMADRFVWTYPIGITVVVIAFGGVILRRAVLGALVLQRAKHVLANDLDAALQHFGPMSGERIVDELKTLSAHDERQRVLRDIHDGFGSRMVTVLARLQREHPGSGLQKDLQRALIDMRLMIDAMDEAARSLDVALGSLRHRLQASLEAQGIALSWDIADLPAQQIDDRRKLMNLFRVVEELISNVMQHAHATRIAFSAREDSGGLLVEISDDGRGLPLDAPCGRGRSNIRRRVAMLGGTYEEGVGLDGRGLGVRLRVPRM